MSEHEGPITVLSEDESWERLATRPMGRLVTRVGDTVSIVPVNFVVWDRTLLFRTAAGSKLAELTVNSSVVFQADWFDDNGGWSVVVHGEARALEHGDEILEAEQQPLRPFVPTVKPTFVRIEAVSISGREFEFGAEPDLEAALQEG